ncbi:MAG: hypothetical protein M1831_004137 [Alyxoria varia]|nr:MAG: hypothetical protein M1831_004137 [Alyxoria varia]
MHSQILPGRLPSSLLSLIFAVLSQADLPYNPTRLLYDDKVGSPLVYVLEPESTDDPKGRLLALRSDKETLDSKSLPLSTVSTSLPFLDDNNQVAYTAAVDDDGNINVYAGQCSGGPKASSLWQFKPDTSSADGDGTWSKKTIGTDDADLSSGQPLGSNYLASSIAFSSTRESSPTIYNFGGMCPDGQIKNNDWTAAAKYSNQMVKLRQESSSDYDFDLGTGKGQPIAEAGFSVTPLQPSYINMSAATRSKQQNFLLLGGHTQDAFINMSQVAVLSLPQASWTFLEVNPQETKTSSSIAPRSQHHQVEPRSGHTAVLTGDGKKVVLFGGWVGDVRSAAEPQLSILEVGLGYGGSHDWTWATAPSRSYPRDAGGKGIYGHGAVMLPGDVMMIYGGYSIPSISEKLIRRQAQTASSKAFFYNVTGNEWISSYDPELVPGQDDDQGLNAVTGPLSTKPQKVGLGVGLTLGLLAVGLVALVSWILARKYRRQRQAREQETHEKEIEDLYDAAHSYSPGTYRASEDRTGAVNVVSVWPGGGGGGCSTQQNEEGRMWTGTGLRDAERTGMDLDIPSPQRGLRKSMHNRPRYDERRWSRGSGFIHPIEELEEGGTGSELERPKSAEDPFKDPSPPSSGNPSKTVRRVPTQVARDSAVSGTTAVEGDRHGWVRDWVATNAVESSADDGRISPDKSNRTHSDLSERSAMSGISDTSAMDGVGSSTELQKANKRNASGAGGRVGGLPTRPLRILPAAFNPFAASPGTSPTKGAHTSPRRLAPAHSVTDSESFMTARSAFDGGGGGGSTNPSPTVIQQYTEQEAPLLTPSGLPNRSSTDMPTDSPGPPLVLDTSAAATAPGTSPNPALTEPEPDLEPTFTTPRLNGRTANKAPTTKVGSWVGSVRRAIHHGGRSTSMTNSISRPPAATGLGGLVAHEVSSTASSPTKYGGEGVTRGGNNEAQTAAGAAAVRGQAAPQRSVSDGAGFSAWAAANSSGNTPRGSHGGSAFDWRPRRRVSRKSAGSTAVQPMSSNPAATNLPGDWGIDARGYGTASGIRERSESAPLGDVADADLDVQGVFRVRRERLRVVNGDDPQD